MRLLGIAFYEDGEYVKFIPVDKSGKMEESFHVLSRRTTTAFAMFSYDDPMHCAPGTIVNWAGADAKKFFNEGG